MKSILTAILIIISTVRLHSQWSSNPNVNNLISSSINEQLRPIIVSDEAGGAIIAWEDNRSGTWKIYAQRINASGMKEWTDDGVLVSTSLPEQNEPEIVSDGAGGSIITWSENRNGNADIYAQRIGADGTLRWNIDGVPISIATDDQTYPIIVSDGAGGAVIAWVDKRNGTSSDIYAQRITGNGIVLWAANGVPITTAPNGQFLPVITTDGTGGAIIAWYDLRSATVENNIYAQRINENGNVMWTSDGVLISVVAADTEISDILDFPVISSDGSGGAFITWSDDRIVNDTTDVFVQRVNANGIVQWVTNGIRISAASGSQWWPNIISDGLGGGIITWNDDRSQPEVDVYAQRIDSSGTVQWATDGISISAIVGSQYDPIIVNDGSGGAIITWEDERSGMNSDIYAQHISADGTAQWTANGVPISTASYFQDSPAIIGDGAGGAIITWEDYRSGTNYDIYAQRVTADGSLGGTTGVDNTVMAVNMFSLNQNYPNPFNPSTKISWQSPIGSHQTLKVYDVLGNEVATLVDEYKTAGSYEVDFNATRLPSGVYFYKLQSGSFVESKKMIYLK